jgi:hypothetical protein
VTYGASGLELRHGPEQGFKMTVKLTSGCACALVDAVAVFDAERKTAHYAV